MSLISWKTNSLFAKAIAILIACSLSLNMLCGCFLDFRHLQVTEEENENSNIDDWDDAETPSNIETWDTVGIASWEEVDELTDPIYSAALFDDSIVGFPEIEVAVLDYRSNGQFFEGEKVYELVGNKFDLNRAVSDSMIRM